jgi:hypothetical protein
VAGTAAICVTAFTVSALGVADSARPWLELELSAPSGGVGAALEIFVANARLAAAVLVGAIAVSSFPGLRGCLDVVCGALAMVNVAVLGVAFGVYGLPLVSRVAMHTALELAAFSLTAGSYLAARDQQLAVAALLLATAIAGVLLVTAAVAETYLDLGSGR